MVVNHENMCSFLTDVNVHQVLSIPSSLSLYKMFYFYFSKYTHFYKYVVIVNA